MGQPECLKCIGDGGYSVSVGGTYRGVRVEWVTMGYMGHFKRPWVILSHGLLTLGSLKVKASFARK